jgi:deoxyribodipyrimidine photolyase
LARQIDASAVYWLNAVEPDTRKDELRLRIALEKHGIEGQGFGGYLLFKPGTIKTWVVVLSAFLPVFGKNSCKTWVKGD